MALTNNDILSLNNGKIVPGDYVVVYQDTAKIYFTPYNVSKVNVVLEKNGVDGSPLNGNPIQCNTGEQNSFKWTCNIQPNVNEDYPLYRLKVISTESNNIIAYSNYFKISVNN